jgi:succinate dehydrogenase hydrophobic anchor subunit
MAAPVAGDQHWYRSPITTRHSQTALLLVSFTWGLSYCLPERLRISFSEVYPADLTKWASLPRWTVGAALLLAATHALIGERVIIKGSLHNRIGWHLSFLSHAVLFTIYATLAIGAIISGLLQAHWQIGPVISAISRPVLWGYIAYLHLTYARLPPPEKVKRDTG